LPDVGANVSDRLDLRSGELEGQGGFDLLCETSFADAAAALERAHARPDQQKRQLVGEQFIEAEPGRRRSGGIDVGRLLRRMQRCERFGEGRRVEPTQRRRAYPFGKLRQALQGALRGARQHARIKPFGQAIDRFDWRKPGERLGVHDAIGMDHLQMAVPEFELAGDPARLAERQRLLDPIDIGEEEDQLDIACVVLDEDFEGRLGARAWRRAIFGDLDLDGCDLIARGVADFGAGAPVERGVGQVKQHIERQRAASEQPVEELDVLRSKPWQRRDRRKERIEQRGAHQSLIAEVARAAERETNARAAPCSVGEAQRGKGPAG
jgi:hypothetical protein